MVIKKEVKINFSQAINQVSRISAEVGFLSSATYENGAKVAMVAAQNEYGNSNKHIPPRPFMRPAKDKNATAWKATFQKAIKQGLRSGNLKSAFDIVSLQVVGDIKKSIVAVTKPALKPATVKARLKGKKQGRSVSLSVAKPLIDSGYMLNSVNYEVKEK